MDKENKENKDLLDECEPCGEEAEREVEANEENFAFVGDLEEIMERIGFNSSLEESIKILLKAFEPYLEKLTEEEIKHYKYVRDRFLSSVE